MAQQATLSLTLAGGSEVPGDRGLAIDLSRVDIETALGSGDKSVELLLDLDAREVDGGAAWWDADSTSSWRRSSRTCSASRASCAIVAAAASLGFARVAAAPSADAADARSESAGMSRADATVAAPDPPCPARVGIA